MNINIMEVVVGALVLVVAGFFLMFSYTTSKWQKSDGYEIVANFDRVDGLSIGSDVRISGVKVGTIVGFSLTPQFLGRVRALINNEIKVPEDSTAEIVGEGLFGPKHMSIVPGGSLKNMKVGGQILRTHSSLSLESLISKFLFSNKGGESKKAGARGSKADKAPENLSEKSAIEESGAGAESASLNQASNQTNRDSSQGLGEESKSENTSSQDAEKNLPKTNVKKENPKR